MSSHRVVDFRAPASCGPLRRQRFVLYSLRRSSQDERMGRRAAGKNRGETARSKRFARSYN